MIYIFSREYDFFITQADTEEEAKRKVIEKFGDNTFDPPWNSLMEVCEIKEGETKLIWHSNE